MLLHDDISEIVNSRRAWAFVGSGVSSDSGLPTWQRLVELVTASLGLTANAQVHAKQSYKEAIARSDFPSAFSAIESVVGRTELESSVREHLPSVQPGALANLLADWPFAGYITTNYDHVLETALRAHSGGWASVGNSDEEIRKVSAGASNLVWHIHGGLSVPSSQIVLTDEDYEELYAETRRPIYHQQLRGVLSQHRVLLFGFGFQDRDLLRLLSIARFVTAQPIIAFFSAIGDPSEREEMLRRYNVKVVSYEISADGAHQRLNDLLAIYDSQIVRRSVRLQTGVVECPSFDPATTGLYLYNAFCLRREVKIGDNTLAILIEARILSLLSIRPRDLTELVADLLDQQRLVVGRGDVDPEKQERMRLAVVDLCDRGFARFDPNEKSASKIVHLTEFGEREVANHRAKAELTLQQFRSSLTSRLRHGEPNLDENAASRVAIQAEAFLTDCVQKRSLGYAMAAESVNDARSQIHSAGLFQNLSRFVGPLSSTEEAAALVRLAPQILRKPTQEEKKFLSRSLQAHFAVAALGMDAQSLDVRTKELGNTLFVIDSETIISLLAIGSTGHETAMLLIQRLKTLGATVVTTELLIQEVIEHAGWASKQFNDRGQPDYRTYRMISESGGRARNQFIMGFVAEVAAGKIRRDFRDYLRACGVTLQEKRRMTLDLERVLRVQSISTMKFEDWVTAVSNYGVEVEDRRKRITQERQQRTTLRGDRQVEAEADVELILEASRNHSLTFKDRTPTNAYFISHSRILNFITADPRAHVLSPEAALQWVATIKPCADEEVTAFADALLWDYASGDVIILDRKQLEIVFGPYLDASREKLNLAINQYRDLIGNEFGSEAIDLLRDVPDFDIPDLLASLQERVLSATNDALQRERARIKDLQAKAKLSTKDREELARLRADQKRRELRQAARKRAAKSRKGPQQPHKQRKKRREPKKP